MRLLSLLLLASPPQAAPADLVGDGGSQRIRFDNQTVYRLTARVGVGDVLLEAAVEPFATAEVFAQCLGDLPTVQAGTDALAPVSLQALDFPDGPPAIWISKERRGRAALEKRVAAVSSGVGLIHLRPEDVPPRFATLRFSPLILVELDTWAELDAERQAAVAGAVAAGAVLVLGAGDGPVAADALRGLTRVHPGDVARPGPALTQHLPDAAGRRVLRAGEGTRILAVADEAPLLVEQPLGLGVVRVLGVRLGELTEARVSAAAFGAPPDALGGVLSWLQAAPPLAEARAAPLAPYVWWALWALGGLAVLARWRPRLAVGLTAPLLLVSLALPPNSEPLTVDAERVLYLPVGSGALAVGTLDLTLQRAGSRGLRARTPRLSLDDARPGGGCALLGPDGAALAVDGEPGDRRRLALFALVDMPPAGPAAEPMPAWPGGPLAGAPRREALAEPLTTPAAARRVAFSTQLRPTAATPPIQLTASPPIE